MRESTMRERMALMYDRLGEELTRTATYYDRTAATYDSQVDGLPLNRELRDAFRHHVARLAGPEGTILDFGCGTGTDAAWYAERGHRVLAYDISIGMTDILRARCEQEIEHGQIVPIAGSIVDLEGALQDCPPLSAIGANFAVLNHIEDLAPLFRLLGSHLRPGGSLVASLLNPWYRGDVRQRWWWRALPRSVWTGAITVRGEVTTHRHFVRSIRRAARPYLDLVALGRHDTTGRRPRGRMGVPGPSGDVFINVLLRRRA
jgi:SAM-dependent methyltransferase